MTSNFWGTINRHNTLWFFQRNCYFKKHVDDERLAQLYVGDRHFSLVLIQTLITGLISDKNDSFSSFVRPRANWENALGPLIAHESWLFPVTWQTAIEYQSSWTAEGSWPKIVTRDRSHLAVLELRRGSTKSPTTPPWLTLTSTSCDRLDADTSEGFKNRKKKGRFNFFLFWFRVGWNVIWSVKHMKAAIIACFSFRVPITPKHDIYVWQLVITRSISTALS